MYENKKFHHQKNEINMNLTNVQNIQEDIYKIDEHNQRTKQSMFMNRNV